MDTNLPRRTMSAKRASLAKPLDVRRILNEQGASEARPDYVAAPPSPSGSQQSTESSGRTSFQSHGRTMSIASVSSIATPGRTNRFSMQFPIQPATREQSPARPTSSPAKDAAPDAPTGPSDTNFLTAIAAQERRVLELKEELQRAETELKKLKKNWANHEVYKKKNDVRMLAKLEPVNTNTAPPTPVSQDDEDGSGAWLQQEMERRKALLSNTRTSSRTVFSGSRHARTLSLLSPTRTADVPTPLVQHPPRQDSLPRVRKKSNDSERPPLKHSTSMQSGTSSYSTTPDISAEVAKSTDIEIDLTQANVDREVLIKHGKKMATDFKDGLWTFWEDLRQATVGDEATQAMAPSVRKQSSTQTLKTAAYRDSSRASRGSATSKASAETRRAPTRSPVNRRPSPASVQEEPQPQPLLIDTAGTFWTEAGLPVPDITPAPIKKASKHSKTPSAAPSVDSSADAWDTWDDNPKDSRSSSSATSESVAQVSTSATTPRHSAGASRDEVLLHEGGGAEGREKEKEKDKEPLPWPALAKLRPTSLRRTASHLMSEWEKSMTPEPGEEFRGEESEFLGLVGGGDGGEREREGKRD